MAIRSNPCLFPLPLVFPILNLTFPAPYEPELRRIRIHQPR